MRASQLSLPKLVAWRGPLVVLIALAALAGCGSSAPPPTEQEVHLKHLAIFYGQYTSSHQGQGPENADAFKAFIKQQSKGMGTEQLEAYFVSPRDQQPYVIAYNVRLGAMPASGAPIVAHEAVGVEGKQFAADALGGVRELDKAEVEQRALKGK